MIKLIKKYFFKQAFLIYSYMLNLLFFVLDLMPHFIRNLFFKLSFKKLGKNVMIDYKYLNLPDTSGDIIIKEYVWIGGNSVVLQGVTVLDLIFNEGFRAKEFMKSFK